MCASTRFLGAIPFEILRGVLECYGSTGYSPSQEYGIPPTKSRGSGKDAENLLYDPKE